MLTRRRRGRFEGTTPENEGKVRIKTSFVGRNGSSKSMVNRKRDSGAATSSLHVDICSFLPARKDASCIRLLK